MNSLLLWLLALGGVILATAGVIAYLLRKRGQPQPPISQEERETIEGLDKAFGRNMKWSEPGAAESELHEAHHADDAGLDDSPHDVTH